MKIESTTKFPAELAADAIVVGVFEGSPLNSAAVQIDRASVGVVSKLLETESFSGSPNELVTLWSPPGLHVQWVVLVGLGPLDDYAAHTAYHASATAARAMATKAGRSVGFYMPIEHQSDAIAGALVGCKGQNLYRKEPNLHAFKSVYWHTDDRDVVDRGVSVADGINLARELVNQPPNYIYPESFAERASQLASDCGLQCEVWDKSKLELERCGSMLAVARGSSRDPRLVILSHLKGPEGGLPLALVGKGVTFDSGGLSLKPNDGMKDMKCDMAGAATVVGAMQTIARLDLPVNVIGLVGLVENMVSGDSYKLGDVLTARNGKTIEVLNTDAEGRLVLADVLDVAVKRGSDKVVDLATLTGACLVALGMEVAGVMSNNEDWQRDVLAAAGRCGEQAWPLPMFPAYAEQIKSEVADIKNVGNGRWGGAITAAKFLEEFVGETPWVHIDIAGPAWQDSPNKGIDGGATGAFVRTLVELARTHR